MELGMKRKHLVAGLCFVSCMACGHHKKPADYDAEMRNAAIAGVREKIGKAEIAFFPDSGHLGYSGIDGSKHTNSVAGDCIVRRGGKLIVGHFDCHLTYSDDTYGTGRSFFMYYEKLTPKEIEDISRRRVFPRPLIDELLAQK